MLAVRLRQTKHLTPPKPHQRRRLGDPDPAIRQIVQHAHPVDLRPAHRNHRHRPNTPHTKLRRVTSLSGPTVTSLSGVYTSSSRNAWLWNDCSWRKAVVSQANRKQLRWTVHSDLNRLPTAGRLCCAYVAPGVSVDCNRPIAAAGCRAGCTGS